jgi:hypothetical protein
MNEPLSIAIVGVGPRGLSVLERLLVRLRQNPAAADVVIWAIDPVEHGPGRVWRTTQPTCLTMNATASEVTLQSPDSHVAGPDLGDFDSLATWCRGADERRPAFGPVDYPPRRVYGEYLKDVFDRLCASAPPGVRVRPVLGEATGLTREAGGMRLTVDGGRLELGVDKVVLATGHSPQQPPAEQRALLDHAERSPGCAYLDGGVAADMPLECIAPGATVAVRGLGLTFYDVVRSLSVGRGGQFDRPRSGALRYRPSGREPHVVAGSRGGLPFLARPRMTEPPETAPRPVVLTEERITALRARATVARGAPQLDFAGEVEPLIRAEVELAYRACAARLGTGWRSAVLPGRLDSLARPFEGRRFSTPRAFRRRLLSILRADVVESRKGTAESPLKAGLEVLRQIRPVLPAVVDFGGLLPLSHRDFLTRFEPLSYVLSAGPPDTHVEELVALIDAGIVQVVGPAANFGADPRGGFFVESPPVAGSRRRASVMVEARVPACDIATSASPLLLSMLASGLISQHVNAEAGNGDRFATGGVAVTRSPFHVIDAWGQPNPDVHAIGVATDGTRWFTQVGTGRPGQDSPFCRDADAIAAATLVQRAERVTPACSCRS